MTKKLIITGPIIGDGISRLPDELEKVYATDGLAVIDGVGYFVDTALHPTTGRDRELGSGIGRPVATAQHYPVLSLRQCTEVMQQRADRGRACIMFVRTLGVSRP